MIKYLFIITLSFGFISCTNKSEGISSGQIKKDEKFFFQDFQEILEEFVITKNPEYLISQSKDRSTYERIDSTSNLFKKITLSVNEDWTQTIRSKEDVIADLYSGTFYISSPMSPDKIHQHQGTLNINFYLPSEVEITLKNIEKHNKYEFTSGFITGDETTYSGSRYEHFYGTDKKFINGSGELLKMNEIHEEGFYLNEFIKDTIEYAKLTGVNTMNGMYFKKNIVHTTPLYNQTERVPDKFNGEIIKYIDYEGEYLDGQKVGLHVNRRYGIVETEILYEDPDRWIDHVEYWTRRGQYDDLYFESENGLMIKKNRIDGVKYVWTNQDKLGIEVDDKGFKSYTPEVTLEKHRRSISIEGSDEKTYVYHGPYKKYEFFPTDEFSDVGNLQPTILANYVDGFLDGNIRTYGYYGLENFNGTFSNGQFLEGVFRQYDSDYSNGDRMIYTKKEEFVDENGLKWKEYDSSGTIVDEGFRKTTPNEYFYGDRNGLNLDFDNKGYDIRKNR